MKIAFYSEEVDTWHKIVFEPGLDFSQIIESCLDYKSPYRFNCKILRDSTSSYKETLTISFESKEDHMIFAFRWMGL